MVRVLIVILLLAVSASAQVSGRRDSLRQYALDKCFLPTAGTDAATAAKLNRQLNLCIYEVSTDFPAVEKWDTVVFSMADQAGLLNADFDRIASVARIVGDTTIKIYVPMSPFVFDNAFDANLGFAGVKHNRGDSAQPRGYATFRGSDKGWRLFVYPREAKPADAADSFLVHYYAIGRQLDSDTAQTDIHPSYFDELLSLYAGRIQELRMNYAAADRFLAQYESRKPPINRDTETRK